MASPWHGAGTLQALVEGQGEQLRVRAPAVGLWLDPPHEGARLSPGAAIGWLMILGRRRLLRLTETTQGQVVGVASAGRRLAVEYGQTLFELDASAGVPKTGQRPPGGGTPAASAGLPEGAHVIVAPTDGVFYTRPAPDQPPFTRPGARIQPGQPVGLVEVMKTFNQILYGGGSAPAAAEVLEIRAADGQEVASGEILLVVRAVG